jgi:hypothetical protein
MTTSLENVVWDGLIGNHIRHCNRRRWRMGLFSVFAPLIAGVIVAPLIFITQILGIGTDYFGIVYLIALIGVGCVLLSPSGLVEFLKVILLSVILITVVGWLIFIPLGISDLVKASLSNRVPRKHPIAKSIARATKAINNDDLERSVGQIEQEIQASDSETVGSTVITRSWLIYPSEQNLEVMLLKDIIWLCKIRGKIEGAELYSAVAHDVNGNSISIQKNFLQRSKNGKPSAGILSVTLLSEQQVDRIINIIVSRFPWIITESSTDMQQRWLFRRSDMVQELTQAVDSRRRQILG